MHDDYELPLPNADNPLPIYDELYIQHQKWKTAKEFGQPQTGPTTPTDETDTDD